MFFSLPLRKFNCKDNIKDEQKSSASILFNLKLMWILRNFLTIHLKYSRWKRPYTEIFAVGLACKQTCTGFADKHWKPTREGSAVHSYATKFPLSGKHNFPYTEIIPLRCRVYQTRLSLPFGIDDFVAADYLCQQKKAMENGKHKTNSFNSSNSWSKKQSLLPSFQGGAGGRLSPNQVWMTVKC